MDIKLLLTFNTICDRIEKTKGEIMQQATMKDFMDTQPYKAKYKKYTIKKGTTFYDVKEYDNGIMLIRNFENGEYKIYRKEQ